MRLGGEFIPTASRAQSPAVRQASLKSTALLTRAYRTLRDPVARGRYWLELMDEKLAENNQRVPADLAELVFEVQEQLGELRGARNGSANSLGVAMKARRAELEEIVDTTQEELERNFARWDSGAGERQELVNELKSALSRIAYLRTLTRDVDRALEARNGPTEESSATASRDPHARPPGAALLSCLAYSASISEPPTA